MLPDDAHRSLERSLPTAECLTRDNRAESVASSLRDGRFDAFVFDPAPLGAGDFATVVCGMNQSAVPTLLFATLQPVSARRIVSAVDVAPCELILRGFDDTPALIRSKLSSIVEPSAPALLLQRASPHFRWFPDGLQVASVSLFCRCTLPRWVTGFARETGLARRTVDRWMDIGGISGAARLLDVTRLARVWEPLVERDVPAHAVAVRFGYGTMRLLNAHARRLTGVSTRDLGDHYTRQTFGARLADALIS